MKGDFMEALESLQEHSAGHSGTSGHVPELWYKLEGNTADKYLVHVWHQEIVGMRSYVALMLWANSHKKEEGVGQVDP